MTDTTARHAVYGELMWPDWNPISESHGAGQEKANALLDAHAAEVLGPLPEMFGGLNRMIATSSKDWGEYAPDAWLYGLFCGWGCEDNHEHDDICGGEGAMEEMTERHGWSTETVARLRRYRAAVLAATGEPFPDPRFAAAPSDPGSSR